MASQLSSKQEKIPQMRQIWSNQNIYLRQKLGMYDNFTDNTIVLREMYDTLLKKMRQPRACVIWWFNLCVIIFFLITDVYSLIFFPIFSFAIPCRRIDPCFRSPQGEVQRPHEQVNQGQAEAQEGAQEGAQGEGLGANR